jgi:hypothetical protein
MRVEVFHPRHIILMLVLGEVDLAHPDQQRTEELPEFQAELEQPEEQNK